MTSAKSKFGSVLLLSLLGPGKIFQQKSKGLSMMERKFLAFQVAKAASAMEIQESNHGSFGRHWVCFRLLVLNLQSLVLLRKN